MILDFNDRTATSCQLDKLKDELNNEPNKSAIALIENRLEELERHRAEMSSKAISEHGKERAKIEDEIEATSLTISKLLLSKENLETLNDPQCTLMPL